MAQKACDDVSKVDDAIHAGDVMKDAMDQIEHQDPPKKVATRDPPEQKAATRICSRVRSRTRKPVETPADPDYETDDSDDDVPIAKQIKINIKASRTKANKPAMASKLKGTKATRTDEHMDSKTAEASNTKNMRTAEPARPRWT